MTERTTKTRDASIKVRRRDYDEARKPTADLPIDFIDVFSAMTHIWAELPESKRMDALRRVRRMERADKVPAGSAA